MKRSLHPSRLFVYLGLTSLAASLAGTVWLLHSDARAELTPAAEARDVRVVCFGHADVEDGVAALYPLQPGQVEKVQVKEGQEVRAGDVLVSLDRRLADCPWMEQPACLPSSIRVHRRIARHADDRVRLHACRASR